MRFVRISVATATALCLLLLPQFAVAQLIPKADSSAFIVRTIDESSETGRWEIKAEFPQISDDHSPGAVKFNAAVSEHVMRRVSAFKESMMESTDEERFFLPEGVNYSLDIGFAVEFLNKNYAGISFGRSEYTGGAHANHWTSTLNFDLNSGLPLELRELFKPGSDYLSLISRKAVSDLERQIGEFLDEDWVKGGAGPAEENFQSWAISEKGLKFFFDPYQVAAYAAGDFEITVPYEAFPDTIRSDRFDGLAQLSYRNGNPPNWCRNGLFPSDSNEFRLVTVKGGRRTRAYFYEDNSGCPFGENCRRKAYVVGGDKLIVSRSYSDFICAWFQPARGSETVGWIRSDVVRYANAAIAPGPGEWVGSWTFYGNDLKITLTGDNGRLAVRGNAFWKGAGDNIHIGEVDGEGVPVGNTLRLGGEDEYDCKVEFRLVGRYLIVSDNKMCGGVNVTFDGVYRKAGRAS